MRGEFSLLDLLSLCDAASRTGQLASPDRLRALAALARGLRTDHPVILALQHAGEVSALIEADDTASPAERTELLSQLAKCVEQALHLPEELGGPGQGPKVPIPIDRGPGRPSTSAAWARPD